MQKKPNYDCLIINQNLNWEDINYMKRHEMSLLKTFLTSILQTGWILLKSKIKRTKKQKATSGDSIVFSLIE